MAVAPKPVEPKYMGQRIRRREDPRLITGSATYVDDLKLPGTLYMGVLRSPYAHARITRIDVERARGLPNVVAAITADDIADVLTSPMPVEVSMKLFAESHLPRRGPLATDKVRCVGDAVAVIVATDRYTAKDALEAIEVEYETLPAVTDPERALAEGAPLLYEEFGTNQATHSVQTGGDLDAAFAQADRIVTLRLVNQRVFPTAMEPRCAAADYHAGTNTLTLWASTQIPHSLRTQLAGLLGLPENQVRVIAPEVGGGFGNKIDVAPEEVLAAVLAMRTGRPVKWIEERRENFLAAKHGRDQIDYLEAAVKQDGTIAGLKVRTIADLGAWYQFDTPLIAVLTSMVLPGPYKVPAVSYELTQAFTNKTPVGAYRGAGRPEATYLMECLIEKVADELGLDPADVRRKNFIPPEAFPYTTPMKTSYDSGEYARALDRALELAGYADLRKQQAEALRQGRLMGIGLSAYLEICSFGPWESATVRVEAGGQVTAYTGTSPHGQGGETSMAQIVADLLGVRPEEIVVHHGDTASTPTGIGTMGSRSAAVGGSAMLLAGQQVRAKAVRIAAHLMEASPEDVTLEAGRWTVQGAPQKAIGLKEIAAAAYGGKVPTTDEPGLEATRFFNQPVGQETFPFGIHLAVVEVDSDTGRVTLQRYVAVDDVGPVINPMIVDGQRHGGIAQGAAQALLEEVVYDETGQLVTGSLMDYAIPTAHMLPDFELDRTETPSPRNPLGVKGVGEAGTIGSTPAVRNAVLDALSQVGIRDIDMPCTAPKVWRLLQEAKARAGQART
jgi:aerobic carbon-monoxide dehydrogenase large subunit